MRAENCDRYGAEVHGERKTYAVICRRYVCDACGGSLVHRFAGGPDRVECGRCGGDELISEMKYLEQIADAYEVEQGLPEALRSLLRKDGGACPSATEATADLFD